MEKETALDVCRDLNTTLQFFIRGSYMNDLNIENIDTLDQIKICSADLGSLALLKSSLEITLNPLADDIFEEEDDNDEDITLRVISLIIHEAEQAIFSPETAPLYLSRAMSQDDDRVQIFMDSLKTFHERLTEVIDSQ
jgi:hypothetical protein